MQEIILGQNYYKMQEDEVRCRVRKVYTYDTPEWRNHSEFVNMPQALHICATGNMKRGIEEKYKAYLNNINTIRTIITNFEPFQEWYNPEKRMQQYLTLSNIVYNYNFENPELARSFKVNQEQVLETVRFLVQAGHNPSVLDGLQITLKERQFQGVWESLEDSTEDFINHRMLLQSSNWQQKFRQQFNFNNSNKIYLHGFYFITPEQQLFLKFLERQGFELIFFQYYDARFPSTFNFIKQFINDDYGWSSDWHITKELKENSSTLGAKFLAGYEDECLVKTNVDKSITKYTTFFDFLQDVVIPKYPIDDHTFVKNDDKIFAPQAKELNEFLQVQYPSLDKKKQNFLSHPLGKFLVDIHKVWKEGELHLNEILLMELFSSGWLIDEKTNEKAKNYTYDLQQIFPYFKGCELLEDWNQRIKNLYISNNAIREQFNTKNLDFREEQLTTPFNKFSYQSIPLERLAQIKDFIGRIKHLAENLFDGAQGISSIDKHFQKLVVLLQERKRTQVYTDTIEVELLDTLLNRLKYVKENQDFLYDDIHSALSLYLNGKFSEPDINDEIITDFLEVDGEMFKKNTHEIILTGLDEKALPLSGLSLPWPLTQDTVEELGRNSIAIQLFINRNNTVKETSRFLFYIALEFLTIDTLKFSWLANRGSNEDMNSTMYIRQLGLKSQLYIPNQYDDTVKLSRYDLDLPTPTLATIDAFKDSVKESTIQMEYILCPKRFYYSYILEPYATFSEDFIHSFMYTTIFRTTLTSLKLNATQYNIQQIVKKLTPYFPQFEKYRMHAIGQSSKYPYRFNTDEGIQTVKSDTILPGLKRNEKKGLAAEVTRGTIKEIVQLDNNFRAQPTQNCKYCPHQSYCMSAQYSVDK